MCIRDRVPINHVGQTLAVRDTWKRVVGITLAYAGLVWPTSNQRLAIKLARWAKWHRANIIFRRRANKTADKIPTLTQQMIAIWVFIFVKDQIHVIENCNIVQLNTILFGMLQIKFIFLFFNAMNWPITAVWMALKLHLAYVLRWNRGKNIYFFSHI